MEGIVETLYCTVEREELKRLQADSLILRALTGGHCIEGFVLVPVEPTSKMTYVGQQMRYDSVNSIGAIYRAMLDAARLAAQGESHE